MRVQLTAKIAINVLVGLRVAIDMTQSRQQEKRYIRAYNEIWDQVYAENAYRSVLHEYELTRLEE